MSSNSFKINENLTPILKIRNVYKELREVENTYNVEFFLSKENLINIQGFNKKDVTKASNHFQSLFDRILWEKIENVDNFKVETIRNTKFFKALDKTLMTRRKHDNDLFIYSLHNDNIRKLYSFIKENQFYLIYLLKNNYKNWGNEIIANLNAELNTNYYKLFIENVCSQGKEFKVEIDSRKKFDKRSYNRLICYWEDPYTKQFYSFKSKLYKKINKILFIGFVFIREKEENLDEISKSLIKNKIVLKEIKENNMSYLGISAKRKYLLKFFEKIFKRIFKKSKKIKSVYFNRKNFSNLEEFIDNNPEEFSSKKIYLEKNNLSTFCEFTFKDKEDFTKWFTLSYFILKNMIEIIPNEKKKKFFSSNYANEKHNNFF